MGSIFSRAMGALVVMMLSGCIIVPFIQAFKETGATPADRMALLQPEAKKFSDAVVMGNKIAAMAFVLPESRSEVSKQIKGKNEDEKVVETRFDDVQWGEDAWNATVTMKVKYFKVPFYIVETRTEEQRWEFSMADGWKLRGFSIVEEG